MTEAVASDPLLGRLLGDFVVQAKLGEGGFGAVYRAEQPLLARQAVIKVLHGRHRAAEDVIQRFLREAKLASKLDHPYAAHTYAFGAEPDGLLWIAMELVRGTPLDQLLKASGPVSLERFVPLLDKLCEVLSTAHEQGIVHRDIKPANVMVLARAGRLLPKLLDFGIAKALDAEPAAAAAAPRIDSGAIALDGTAGSALTARGGEGDRIDRGDGDAALTRAGAVLGSPPYMAPEQWVNAPTIGPRTDLYALGVLAYEALTGKPPFVARTMMAMARAHAQQAVPPLGDRFPAALDRVLHKAMAKRPEARFEGALELAAAFREAAGFAADPDSLPRLDEAIREAAIAELPQPLAEAVAAYEGARNLHQAHEALGEICAIAAHLVGVIALAARTRVGAAGDTPAAAETLRILRRRTLADAEWVDLARALVRPFAGRADAYPVPELVALFAGDDPFVPLFAVFADRGRAPAGESEARARIDRALPAVQRLLRALAFLGDYPLAVARGAIAERWVGLRRGRRTGTPLPRAVPEGQPLLLGRDDAPVLLLWPLAQVGEPVPGAPEELFLLEGQGRQAARLVARPGGFERRDDEIWAWLRTQIGDEDEAAAAAAEERAPFRGLSAFTAEDADLFVGRERETEAVVNRLRAQPFVAVVGPSGAGKSSFVHAGVVPALPADWLVLGLRPGGNPLLSLCVRVSSAVDAPALAERIRATPSALRDLLCTRGRTVVLAIDQFEETFTLGSDEAERRAFVEAIAAASRTADDPVRVILTLRDDFLMRAEAEPALRPRLQRGLQLVGTPSREDLERILVEPARRAGYDFEDRALPAEMVAGVAGRAGALPLLSFTASKMWELRDRHFKQLPRKVYDALGGVAGALAQHAEQTLAAMSAEDQRLVREAFRHLVTADGTRAVLSRAELGQVLGPGAPAVLEQLIGARLLSASEADGGGDRVEVAHEALLVAWPRLVRWRQEDAEGARLRDQLRAAARQWQERGRPAGLLWRDEALAELAVWRTRHGGALTEVEAGFADGSVALATRGRRRSRTIAASIFAILLAASIGLFALGQRARASAREAKARVAELYEDQGRQALLDEDPYRALVYLQEAMRGGRDDAALRFLVGRALARIEPLQRTLRIAPAAIAEAHRTADGARLLATTDNHEAILLDVASGKRLAAIGPAVAHAILVDRDRTVVAACMDGKLRWFDARDGAARGESPLPLGASTYLQLRALGPEGARFAVGNGPAVQVWDAVARRPLRALDAGDPVAAEGLVATADGRLLAAGTEGGRVRVWRTDDGHLVLDARVPIAIAEAFSPDAERLAVGTGTGPVALFDLRTGARRATFGGHVAQVRRLEFSRDGKSLLTGSDDRTARVWDVATGEPRWSLSGHRTAITAARFSPDGARALTSSFDGSLRLWDLSSGRALAIFPSHGGYTATFAWDGARAWALGADGTVRVWATDRTELERTLRVGVTVRYLAESPDGQTLYASALDHGVTAWDLGTGAQRWRRELPAPPGDAYFSVHATPEPIAIVQDVGHTDAAVRWSLTDGARGARYDGGGVAMSSFIASADERWVVTGHEDGSGRLFDARDGRLLHTFHGSCTAYLSGVRVSPDGREIAGGCESDTRVHRWRVDEAAELPPIDGHASRVTEVAYSPDGRFLASASADRTAKVWSVRDGALVATLEGHQHFVETVAFSPDSELVVTGSSDGTARVWSRATGRPLAVYDADATFPFIAVFDRRATHLFAAGFDGIIKSWSTPSFGGDLDALLAASRCRVPFAFTGSHPVPRALPAECDNLPGLLHN